MSAPQNDVVVTLTYTEEEAREVARAFLYFTSNVSAGREDYDRMALIRESIKRAIPQPKPDEPIGIGAVVEDATGGRWIKIDEHFACNDWTQLGATSRTDPDHNGDKTVRWEYVEIDAVRVLSEGWRA